MKLNEAQGETQEVRVGSLGPLSDREGTGGTFLQRGSWAQCMQNAKQRSGAAKGK
jgi:hypothetical protein